MNEYFKLQHPRSFSKKVAPNEALITITGKGCFYQGYKPGWAIKGQLWFITLSCWGNRGIGWA